MWLIQLMSPDFQISNKLFGRRLLVHAEAANDVSPDQHGSRKHNKKLLCDWAVAVARNDAKGNYDRISHPIAALTMMSYGLPKKLLCSSLRLFKSHNITSRLALVVLNSQFMEMRQFLSVTLVKATT